MTEAVVLLDEADAATTAARFPAVNAAAGARSGVFAASFWSAALVCADAGTSNIVKGGSSEPTPASCMQTAVKVTTNKNAPRRSEPVLGDLIKFGFKILIGTRITDPGYKNLNLSLNVAYLSTGDAGFRRNITL